MNYFQLFDIPVSLNPDKQTLKQKFYELSRKYHPDFFTQENSLAQEDALDSSSQVNRAYKTLQNRDDIIRYVLMQKGLLEEEEKYQLPPDFLMEVMELNEQMEDAKAENDSRTLTELKSSIAALQESIYLPVKELVENYDDNTYGKEELLPIKDYYFKKKYLNRILATMG